MDIYWRWKYAFGVPKILCCMKNKNDDFKEETFTNSELYRFKRVISTADLEFVLFFFSSVIKYNMYHKNNSMLAAKSSYIVSASHQNPNKPYDNNNFICSISTTNTSYVIIYYITYEYISPTIFDTFF